MTRYIPFIKRFIVGLVIGSIISFVLFNIFRAVFVLISNLTRSSIYFLALIALFGFTTTHQDKTDKKGNDYSLHGIKFANKSKGF
jgi:hypothetical protein